MFRSRVTWILMSKKRFKAVEIKRSFCSNPTTTSNTDKAESSLSNYDKAYRQLDKLDFMTAAKILFNGPPKKKKFGIDFHLVQLFFVCMPSLAVYLVAQYARYEMRRMEEELEQKKKKEEEEKAKEVELTANDEKEAGSIPELLEVKERLDKLEETVKEIVVVSKKQSGSALVKDQDVGNEKKHVATAEANNRGAKEVELTASKEKEVGSIPEILKIKDQKGKMEDVGFSRWKKRFGCYVIAQELCRSTPKTDTSRLDDLCGLHWTSNLYGFGFYLNTDQTQVWERFRN
ncbi:hypothetical protein FNV43_RR07043 [Rhamnella rubrinervis]|uniref:Uncharacterized protein n=1 Tax=Rhamnella rubrinervis TaxID=2594499 RepID=A0A8K0HEY7_9ROSA|nr:hypothetical protein FNV43_RR07043 [Rhamnella rubrinervis]